MSCDTACSQLDLHSSGKADLIAWAFEAGATDYMLKPFAATESVAKVRSALRREVTQVQNEPSEPLALGDLTIDCAERDECKGADRGLSNRIRCGGRE